MRKLGLEVMLTEIIPGGDDQLFSFHHRRRRKRQPAVPLCKAKTAPVSTWFCYHVEEWNPIVAELGWSFFEAIGLRGFAYVELSVTRVTTHSS